MFQTPDLSGTGASCNGNCRVGGECKCRNPSKCLAIPVPNDPEMKRVDCFFITRSSSTAETQNGGLVRQQINQLSSVIDGTTVYGATEEHAEAVKDLDKMQIS